MLKLGGMLQNTETLICQQHVDLDRINLGNARLQGLPRDVLHGDPTGVLFDWVTSAFYFSYVSYAAMLYLCNLSDDETTRLYVLFQPSCWQNSALRGSGSGVLRLDGVCVRYSWYVVSTTIQLQCVNLNPLDAKGIGVQFPRHDGRADWSGCVRSRVFARHASLSW